MSREQAFLEAQKLYEKQIAELETELASRVDLLESEKSNLFRTLEEANDELAELKQQLAEKDKEVEEIKDFISRFDCNNFNEFETFISTFMLTPHEQETLILDLQHQLHTQPREIIEKIRENLANNNLEVISTIDNYSYTENFLEQILKEYEEE